MRRYETFLIRHWWLDGGVERVEVTHVPTGNRVLLLSLTQAVEWMSARMPPPAESPGVGNAPVVDRIVGR